MQNLEIKKQETLDKLLPLNGLIEAGKKYAGGDDPNNYLLSPINGIFKGLGNTLVFYGTLELFYPDCKLLAEKVKGFENFTFHEFPEMQHDWVVFPIPEAVETLIRLLVISMLKSITNNFKILKNYEHVIHLSRSSNFECLCYN